MSASATAKVIIEVLSTVTDKEKRNKLFIIILVPITLISLVIVVIFKPSTEDALAYAQAVENVKKEYGIVNELNPDLVRTIKVLINDDVAFEQHDIENFIIMHFIKEETISYVDESGVEVYYSYYRFLEYNEIIFMLQGPPFFFDEEKITLINAFYESVGELEFTGKFPMPCYGQITSVWGERIHPISGKLEKHTGIDICGEWHQPIKSIADGIVVKTNTNKSGYGNYITIKHVIDGETFYSFYAHLSEIKVSVNDKVTQSQIIALEGGDQSDNNPGTSTGHHLHFELRRSPSGGDFDPLPYFT